MTENGQKVLIQCATTHGEKQIGKYYLDGYAEVRGKRIGLDFHGCRWHHCPHNCSTITSPTARPLDQEKIRYDFIRNRLNIYIVQYECEFRNMRYKPVGNIFKFQYHEIIREDELIRSVVDGSFYGLINVDLRCPQNVVEKYKHLGIPFIFRNIELTEEHLSPPMLDLAKKNKIKFPKRQLCITYNADEILLVSQLLQFYLSLGYEVEKIHYAIQYIPGRPFAGFVKDLTDMRIQATYMTNQGRVVEGNMRQTLAKIILNSSYGRMGMNLSKRENVIYCRGNELHNHVNNVLYKRRRALKCEYDIDLYEVTKIKRKQTDCIPVVAAFTILQKAKMHMLKYALFHFDNLRPRSFSLLYSDTDSLSMALVGEMDDLVKPEMRESWERKKFDWYTKNDTPEEMRCPGKFKPEYETNTGRYIGVSSKCYMLTDDKETKISTKGVPSSAGLDYDSFISGIYNGEKAILRQIALINYSQINQTMVTRNMTKKCINSCYIKFQAEPNLNKLHPLKLNNKLL